MLGSNRRASQTNIPSLTHRRPPSSLPLLSPVHGVPFSKIVLTCRQSVIMPDFSLTHFQFLSYSSLSAFLSSTTPSKSRHCPLCYLLSAFSCSPSLAHRFDKTAPGRYFQGVAPAHFLSTLFHKQALNSTPLLEEENSIRSLITASSGMQSSAR